MHEYVYIYIYTPNSLLDYHTTHMYLDCLHEHGSRFCHVAPQILGPRMYHPQLGSHWNAPPVFLCLFVSMLTFTV